MILSNLRIPRYVLPVGLATVVGITHLKGLETLVAVSHLLIGIVALTMTFRTGEKSPGREGSGLTHHKLAGLCTVAGWTLVALLGYGTLVGFVANFVVSGTLLSVEFIRVLEDTTPRNRG